MSYKVYKQGQYQEDDGFEQILPSTPNQAWYAVALPPCPDCGGTLVWYEAGHVPGARKCMGKLIVSEDDRPVFDVDSGCGSMFSVGARKGVVMLRRERFY